MAIIDKKGSIHGIVGRHVYRTYRDLEIIQSKPKTVKQTLDTKESGVEFGLCSTTGAQIRQAFAPAIRGYDGAMINRLTGVVRRSIQASAAQRGERDLHDACLQEFAGFQFNNNSAMSKVLRVRPEVAFTEENKILINLPAFNAAADLKTPSNSHFVLLKIMAVAFDFKKGVYRYISVKELNFGRWDTLPGQTWLIEEEMPAGRVLMISMSIHAYQPGRPEDSRLNTKQWSPTVIIAAWHIPLFEAIRPLSNPYSAEDRKDTPDDKILGYYRGDYYFNRIKDLRKKSAKKKKSSQKGPQVVGAALPGKERGPKKQK